MGNANDGNNGDNDKSNHYNIVNNSDMSKEDVMNNAVAQRIALEEQLGLKPGELEQFEREQKEAMQQLENQQNNNNNNNDRAISSNHHTNNNYHNNYNNNYNDYYG